MPAGLLDFIFITYYHFLSASFWEASTLSGYPHIPYNTQNQLCTQTNLHKQKNMGNTSKSVFEVKGFISSSASADAFDMSAWYFDLFHTGFNSLPYVNTHSNDDVYSTSDISHTFHQLRIDTILINIWMQPEALYRLHSSFKVLSKHP